MGLGAGARYLAIACGSGLAASIASGEGHRDRLDASEALVRIARARTPDGDFRVGDMFDLPFAEDSFDIVTSFNGVWKGCERALLEVRRVMIGTGRMGLTFWGNLDRVGLMPYFLKVIEMSPPSH